MRAQPMLISVSYDMYRDIEEKLATKRGTSWTKQFMCGLPIGLELPNGVKVGAVGTVGA